MDQRLRYLRYNFEHACKYHMGISGHSIQVCKAFCQKVKDDRFIHNLLLNAVAKDSYITPKGLTIYYEEKTNSKVNAIKPEVIVEVPSPFPYQSNKAVPWRYDYNIISQRIFNCLP